jgi:hypothetical protein
MIPIRIAAALALLLASAPLAAQDGETVHLRFRWQPGMRADVETEQVRVRLIDGRRDSVRIASAYRMEVEEHAEGLAVAYADVRWTELPRADPALGRFYEALSRTMSAGRARRIVSEEGEFLRVDGAAAMAREVNAAVQPLLRDVEATTLANVRQMISGLLSEEALTASAADEWNALVGTWVDAELEVGEPYALESSFQSPLFPGVEIPLRLEFELVRGAAPCDRDDRGTRCVELRMSSVPDQEVMRGALMEFLERAGASADEVEAIFAQMNVRTHLTLITEPRTLRPHLLVSRRLVTTGKGDDSPSQMETRRFVFRYLP